MMQGDEQKRNQLIRDHFDAKDIAGCPLCGESVDLWGGPVTVLPHASHLDRRQGTIGQGSEVIPVFCANCGHMMLIGWRFIPGYE